MTTDDYGELPYTATVHRIDVLTKKLSEPLVLARTVYVVWAMFTGISFVTMQKPMFVLLALSGWALLLITILSVTYFLKSAPKRSEQSMLMLHLYRLWKFTAAAAVVSLSACVSVVAQIAYDERPTQDLTHRIYYTIHTAFAAIVPYALIVGGTVACLWLAIDNINTKQKQRRRAAKKISRIFPVDHRELAVQVLTDFTHPALVMMVMLFTPSIIAALTPHIARGIGFH